MTATGFATISFAEGEALSNAILQKAGFSQPHIHEMARNMLEAQAQECHSHGLYRLISCFNAAKKGEVDPVAEPEITDHTSTIVKADSHLGCSLLAFSRSIDLLAEKASAGGMAALAINRCFHYSALWWDVEQLSQRGLVAMAMNPTYPFVAPYGGTKPLLGTNPFAFSWPRAGRAPYTFDFATSEAARGEVEMKARRGSALPEGWAIDSEGRPTTDAHAAIDGALLTFGGHKGSAISTMIELLAGPMIGDLLSFETSDSGLGAAHGELVLVFDPKAFGAQPDRAEALFDRILDQGARLPSQRRREAEERAARDGLVVRSELLTELRSLADQPG